MGKLRGLIAPDINIYLFKFINKFQAFAFKNNSFLRRFFTRGICTLDAESAG